FFRLVASETWSEGRFRVFGNKSVATAVGLGVPWLFAISGSWWALWLYFGGANQLLAGLAIMLITIHLARVRAPTKYSLIPGVFMVVTTLSALLWETWIFLWAVILYTQGTTAASAGGVLNNVRPPLNTQANALYALIVKGVLYGMAAHGHVTAALRTRMYLEHLFMFITLGDMLGVPVIPPYYSLKILPYAVPNIKSWKQRVFRERDFTDQVF